jgi:hypothetical protein
MDGLALSGAYLRFAVPKHQFNLQIFASDLSLLNRPRYVSTMFFVRAAMTS